MPRLGEGLSALPSLRFVDGGPTLPKKKNPESRPRKLMPPDLFASFSELLNFVSGVCLGGDLARPCWPLRGRRFSIAGGRANFCADAADLYFQWGSRSAWAGRGLAAQPRM